jgi:hypothetical protein
MVKAKMLKARTGPKGKGKGGEMGWIRGVVVAGHGVASGRRGDPRFPGGTIAMQTPYFRERGIDLSAYWPGTLNVDLAPAEPIPTQPVFDGHIAWHPDFCERFVLMPVEVEFKGMRHRGLWYYPHPETKTEHFQRNGVVELLLPRIDGVQAGDTIAVKFAGEDPPSGVQANR